MKNIMLALLLVLNGCTYTPKLKPGKCYEIALYDSASRDHIHILTQYKIYSIMTWQEGPEYHIQILNSMSNGKLLYPLSGTYAFVNAKEFDESVGRMSTQFWFDSPKKKGRVACEE